MPNGPEVWECGFEEGFLEEGDAERSPGSMFGADGSFDQFDMAVTPFLETLIEVGHEFQQNGHVGVVFVELVEGVLYVCVGLGRGSLAFGG